METKLHEVLEIIRLKAEFWDSYGKSSLAIAYYEMGQMLASAMKAEGYKIVPEPESEHVK